MFDAVDQDVESRFWAGVLGGAVEADGDRHEAHEHVRARFR
ncbi:hypothetical protein [Georgenia satyanarayanai]|nr:hypothetical protein [Georgenia satyanarayanai]